LQRVSELVGRSPVRTTGRKIYHFLRRSLRNSNSRVLGRAFRWSLQAHVALTGRLPTGAHRAFASTCQPINPLRGARAVPQIDVAVPFVEKDLPALGLVVEGIYSTVANPIANLFLVTPNDASTGRPRFSDPKSHAELESLQKLFPHVSIRFDRDVLGPYLASQLLDNEQGKPGGWHLQQVLKYQLARTSEQVATLIVDADTVLLSRKVWLDNRGTQLLQFSEEFYQPYMNHFQEYFGLPKTLPVSYVTHHQLMQTDVVNAMFPTEQTLLDWVSCGLTDPHLKISEYESYGTYLLARNPKKVAFGTWSNLWSPHLELTQQLALDEQKLVRDLLPDYCSVSFHSHSQQSASSSS